MKVQNEKTKLEEIRSVKRKGEKGITLMALVVTIIVLLIVSAISLATLTGKNGILKEAEKNKTKTERASIIEKARADVLEKKQADARGKVTKEDLYAVLDKYFKDVPGIEDEVWESEEEWKKQKITSQTDKNISAEIWEIYDGILGDGIYTGDTDPVDEKEIVETTVDRSKLKIGDYIKYEPDDAEDYQVVSQTLKQDKINWRIFNIEEDGSLELIGDPTDSTIELDRDVGYTYGVYRLNEVCKNLYSKKSKEIIARSINIEDIEKHLTEVGKSNRDTETDVELGKTKTYTTADRLFTRFPKLYQYEKGAGVGKTEVQSEGLGVSDTGEEYFSNLTGGLTHDAYKQQVTATQTAYSILVNGENFGEAYKILNCDATYWIASRWARCDKDLEWGISSGSKEKIRSGRLMVTNANGYGDVGLLDFSVRPIVKLDKDVVLGIRKGTVEIPHEIVSY